MARTPVHRSPSSLSLSLSLSLSRSPSRSSFPPPCLRASVVILLLFAAAARSEEPKPAAPPPPGEALIRALLDDDVRTIETGFLKDIRSASDWEALRPKLHAEYLHMLGLDPLPPRTPLEARTTGVLERDGFRVEKVDFQSRPGLHVTANLYLPAKPEGKLPAVLYQSGHSGKGRDGNKTAFQRHGAWFASHGYACLILDTLQLGEVAGIHHGTYRFHRWWWQSRGYTPAGVECWNAIRALDYLETRPEIDMSRIAATGISGGGAATLWIAAADPRIAVAIPVSGMSDLSTYVTDKVIDGHCDCMLLINSHRWDWTLIAALVAPRPLLFANSDMDTIFPMPGNERIAERLRRLYGLLGRPGAFDTVVVPGGHDDKLTLRLPAYRWVNRWLRNDDREVSEPDYPEIEGRELRVFPDALPADAVNDRIDREFVPLGKVDLPPSPAEFPAWRDGLIARIRAESFAAPDEKILVPSFALPAFPPPGEPVWILVEEPPRLGDEPGKTAEAPRDWEKPYIGDASVLRFSPRGTANAAWRSPHPYHIERALAIVGRTADSGRVRDIALAAAMVRERSGGKNPVRAIGRGTAGVLALYAALLEPAIEEVVAVSPPASHHEGPNFLGILRVCDIPDAMGALAPRKLTLAGAPEDLGKRVEAIYTAAGARDRLTMR